MFNLKVNNNTKIENTIQVTAKASKEFCEETYTDCIPLSEDLKVMRDRGLKFIIEAMFNLDTGSIKSQIETIYLDNNIALEVIPEIYPVPKLEAVVDLLKLYKEYGDIIIFFVTEYRLSIEKTKEYMLNNFIGKASSPDEILTKFCNVPEELKDWIDLNYIKHYCLKNNLAKYYDGAFTWFYKGDWN